MKLLRKAEWKKICNDINDAKTTSWELLAENASLQADNQNLQRKVKALEAKIRRAKGTT